jgi:nitrate reductase NapE component
MTSVALGPLTHQGVQALKNNDKITGRTTLMQALAAGEAADAVWYWLSVAADSQDERKTYLQKALEANPLNDDARTALATLAAPAAPVKPAKPSGPTDRQLIEQEVAKRTPQGWQIVSQTETSVQLKQPKKWNQLGLVLFVLLPLLSVLFIGVLGLGLTFFGFLLVFLDYLLKKERTEYVTADQLRRAMKR